MHAQLRESAERDRDQQDREHGNRPAPPALLAFAGEKGKPEQHDDRDDRSDQQQRCFRRRRQERKHRIEPQEEEIGRRRGLNDRRIRLAARTEGAEKDGAGGDRKKNDAGKHDVLPDGVGHEGLAVSVRQLVILLQIRRAPNDASRHGPFVDAEFQHQQHMQADEGDQRFRE